MHQSTKVFDGFSTCFRQWKAIHSHCSLLHGYDISFKVIFQGELDDKGWVYDFAGLKHSKNLIEDTNAKDWFHHMFDHTTIVSFDDPHLRWFEEADEVGLLDLRIINGVGCENFAKFVFDKLQDWVQRETNGRVSIYSVECSEHSKNSAIYINDKLVNNGLK